MFKKLKIKLTMINLVLVSIVLLIIFSSLYTMMKQFLDNQSRLIMTSVAMNGRITNGFIPTSGGALANDERRISSICFYLKSTPNGIPLEISPNLGGSISPNEASNLITTTLNKQNSEGTLTYNNEALRYLKVPKRYGYIFVYLFKSNDTNVLSKLITISLVIGFGSLLMVFAISLFLANRALIPVKNAWEKQKAFVADASHELRTPLAVMHTNMEIVLDNKPETIESQSNWLENIQSEITRMTKLVSDLLFLARADSGEEALSISYFNLSSAIEQIADLFNHYAYEKGIILYSEVQHDVNFSGSEGRIKQLVTILLDNAIKYTPENGYVKLELHANENSIEMSVTDNGSGISKEHLNKIFERFYKVDKSRSGSFGGSGLGLSIADTIVKEHKGTITVSSEVGTGSTFKVTLPRLS